MLPLFSGLSSLQFSRDLSGIHCIVGLTNSTFYASNIR